MSVLGFGDSKWRRCIVCVFLTGLFPQKSPIICGSFAERNLQLKASIVSSPPCTCTATWFLVHVGHTFMHFVPSYPISFSDVTVLSRGRFLVLFERCNTKKKDNKSFAALCASTSRVLVTRAEPHGVRRCSKNDHAALCSRASRQLQLRALDLLSSPCSPLACLAPNSPALDFILRLPLHMPIYTHN